MVGSEAQRAHYKEASPVATVERLHTILAENNIPVTESWQETSSIKTNALRVEFKGTGLGANGKGVSKEFARASGYAELFERYQNDIMGPRVTYGDKLPFSYMQRMNASCLQRRLPHRTMPLYICISANEE